MSEQRYTYFWANNPKRAKLKGRECRILATGRKNTVMIQFTDNGECVTTSFRALRKKEKNDAK